MHLNRRKRMKTVLIFLGISAITLLATFLVQYLGKRWRRLPEFVWNLVGDVLGIVGITDFKKASGIPGNIIGGSRRLVLVPEILAFSHNPKSPRILPVTPPRNLRWITKLPPFFPSKDTAELFVPYVSESHYLFSDQDRIFRLATDADRFISEKQLENRAADFRFRFRDFIRGIDTFLNWAQGIAIVVFIVCALSTMLIIDSRSVARDNLTPVTVYTTVPDGTLTEIHTTFGEQHQSLLKNDPAAGDNIIIAGNVSDILTIGGNIAQICISRKPGERDCGNADSSLHVKAGDTVYLKPYALLQWNAGENVHRTPVNIVITKTEAERLVATGKFTIHDK